jgi:hypothetical protein
MSKGRRMGRFDASKHFRQNLKEFFADPGNASARTPPTPPEPGQGQAERRPSSID